MKSTFSRLFTSLSLILMAALVLIGMAFQWLASRHLVDQAMESLENDGKVIASLFQAYHSDKGISNHDFYMALTVANSVSGADAVICDAQGTLLMCASSPMGCEHTGLRLDESYRRQVFETGICSDIGMIDGLYAESRYMVSVPVIDERTGAPLAIVLVSSPVDNTLGLIRKTSEIFLVVSILVVTITVVVMTFFVRRQATPLQDMERARA